MVERHAVDVLTLTANPLVCTLHRTLSRQFEQRFHDGQQGFLYTFLGKFVNGLFVDTILRTVPVTDMQGCVKDGSKTHVSGVMTYIIEGLRVCYRRFSKRM